MERKKLLLIFSFLPALVPIIAYIIAYPYLPNEVIRHIGILGKISTSSKLNYFYYTFIPLVSAVIINLLIFFYNTRRNKTQKYKHATILNFLLTGSLSVIFLIFLYIQFHPNIVNTQPKTNQESNKIVVLFLGILFTVIGLIMGKVKQNHLIGIRTKSTFSSELIWNKTHKLAQITVSFSGILTIICALLNLPYLFFTMLAFLLVGTLIPVIYARYLYNKGIE